MGRKEYRKDELQAQITYSRLMISGALSLAKILLTNLGDLKKLRVTKEFEEHYERPARAYHLPELKTGKEVRSSREKYLRPTRFCNHDSPEVVALADALGAHNLPEADYVQAAFEFAKEKVYLEILPIDGVEETLTRGTGTCFHLISVFIALCRAAGIPARYKMFAQNMVQVWREAIINADPLVSKWYDALGYFLIEGEGEVYLNGRWIVAHVGPTAERQAAAGLPITRLGEDAIGLWLFAQPGTMMVLESIPLGLGFGSHLLHRIAPGSMERINISVMKEREKGRRIIEAAGGIHAYDSLVRGMLGPQNPSIDLRPRPEIVFGRK